MVLHGTVKSVLLFSQVSLSPVTCQAEDLAVKRPFVSQLVNASQRGSLASAVTWRVISRSIASRGE